MQSNEGPITRRKLALERQTEIPSISSFRARFKRENIPLANAPLIPSSLSGNINYKPINIFYPNEPLCNGINGNMYNINTERSLPTCKTSEEPDNLYENSKQMISNESNSSFSNYLAKLLLFINFTCTLIYFSILRIGNYKKDSEGYGNEPFLSSFEQGMVFKILWCIIFGLITDVVSWKAAFRCQCVLWICFITFSIANTHPYITSIFATICFSSSVLLTSVIGIIHISKSDRRWALLCHLNFLSSSFLLSTQFYSKTQFLTLRKVFVDYIGSFLQELEIFNYIIFPVYIKPLTVVMACCCILSLMFIPLLSDEKVEEMTENLQHSPSYNTSILKKFLKLISLKLIIFLPASCFRVMFNNYIEGSIPILLLVCLSFWVVIPGCDRVVGLRKLLFFLFVLLNALYTMLYFRHHLEYSQLVCIIISSLLFAIHPLFDMYIITEIKKLPLRQQLTGLTFASILSTQFIIKYLTYYFISFKVSEIESSFTRVLSASLSIFSFVW